jgi:hypothetical protein
MVAAFPATGFYAGRCLERRLDRHCFRKLRLRIRSAHGVSFECLTWWRCSRYDPDCGQAEQPHVEMHDSYTRFYFITLTPDTPCPHAVRTVSPHGNSDASSNCWQLQDVGSHLEALGFRVLSVPLTQRPDHVTQPIDDRVYIYETQEDSVNPQNRDVHHMLRRIAT